MKYYIIALLLSFAALAEGQVKQGSLQVGSQFPGMEPIKLLSGGVLDLQSSQSKVIILEFFDTYCTSCIASMPKLKALQKSMDGKIEIYMLTYQDKNTIENFYKKNKFLQEKKAILPTIVADTVLHQMFPHQSVPHSVWIYKGLVQAITHADYVKEKYLTDLLLKGKIDVPVKDDFKQLPTFNRELAITNSDKSILGTVILSGYDSTLTQVSGLNINKDSVGNVSVYFNNMDIFGAYTSLWTKIKKPTYLLLPQRIVWNVRDSSRYFYDEMSSKSYQEWIRENGISYKRTQFGQQSEAGWAELILHDLNTMLGLQVQWTNKERLCLVLKRKNKRITRIVRQGDKIKKVESTSGLMFVLDFSGQYPPAIDEVQEKINLELSTYKNLDELNTILDSYGLELVLENRSIEVLEFKEIIN